VDELKEGGYTVREVRESHQQEDEGEDDEDEEGGDESEPDDDEEEEDDEEEDAESVLLEVDLLDLILAGYSVGELRADGFTAIELREVRFIVSVAALRAGGFSVAELRTAGYSIEDILEAAFTLDELRAGLPADELAAAQELLDPPSLTPGGGDY
jgi:hypothetical protein